MTLMVAEGNMMAVKIHWNSMHPHHYKYRYIMTNDKYDESLLTVLPGFATARVQVGVAALLTSDSLLLLAGQQALVLIHVMACNVIGHAVV